jgi:hypothetical protein
VFVVGRGRGTAHGDADIDGGGGGGSEGDQRHQGDSGQDEVSEGTSFHIGTFD